ncbi:MFS transporter [Salipaludibacillus sp. LMS25]|jgi:MFS family permease|uniref:MFS transporter n=1 Tax=Salipaludibacillus sp. LMS25 TaxID=2924031 RepID=UPI0020D106FA|nr:MFS transporter [Salipaludibacillus sp. LMS25]UTR16518.1 MFS transporter [Salipaludibacillus sp. LMS25]
MSVLTRKNFLFFFLADIISGFGVGMSTIGANWYLLDETGSTSAVGIMLALNVIAGFLVSPLTGILTDKFNRKGVIQLTFILRAVAIGILTAAFILDGFTLIYIYLFAIINGIGWSIYMSASRSLIQELLPEKDLSKGNSLIEISLQVGMFMAGAASGFIYKFAGFETILLINCLMFVTSSIFMIFVKYQSILLVDKDEGFLQSFKKGIHYLHSHQLTFLVGFVAIVPLVCTMIFNVVLPEYVSSTLNADSIVFGFSDMAYGIGGLISGFIAAPFAKKITKNKAITVIFSLAVLTLVGLSFNSLVIIIYLGSFLIGFSNSSIRIIMNTMLMEIVPKPLMGRAMSVWMGISLFLQAVFAGGMGLLIDVFSPGVGFICMAGLMLFGLVLHYFVSKRDIKTNSRYEVV